MQQIATLVIALILTTYITHVRSRSFSHEEYRNGGTFTCSIISFSKSKAGLAFLVISWIVIALQIIGIFMGSAAESALMYKAKKMMM
jgi:hypothetical protein